LNDGVVASKGGVLQLGVCALLQNRTAEEAYLGNLGPALRATVGDRILFHFQNRLNVAVSVHPHGVFYNKSSEGALYSDGTSGEFMPCRPCQARRSVGHTLGRCVLFACCLPS
jgi:hypothetical protein